MDIDDAQPDAELLARCRAGDDTAVRTLTNRYNRRLYRIARGIVRDDDEAEDVVQETYVRAFTGLDKFRGDAAFSTWLTRIAVNEALGRLRQRRPSEALGDNLPADRAASPEQAMAQRELHTLLEAAIDRLPSTFRTVFIARMVEGLSVDETAELFRLRPETVKTRAHRARARLRADLESQVGPLVTSAFSFDGARCADLTERVVGRLHRLRSSRGATASDSIHHHQ